MPFKKKQQKETNILLCSEEETTLLTEEQYDEEYEGQTSILLEEESPYVPFQDDGIWEREYEPGNKYYEEEQGETNILTTNSRCVSRGIFLPENAPEACLIKIIQTQKICVNKIKFVIGSSKSNVDYVINNGGVSRKHAFIIYNDKKFYLIDNNSTNKTFLDGEMLEPLKPVELYHGALIQFSDELYQFYIS